MDQGYVSFGGLNHLGARMTFSRGIRPSVCHIVATPQTTWDRVAGTLEFKYGGKSVAFPGSVSPGPVFYHRRDRDIHRWSVHVYDRRWKWRYPRIDGVYNERNRDGSICSTGKKNIKQLMDLCLSALGETSTDTSSVPQDVYPPIAWDKAKAALELEWLCDLVGMTVALKLDNSVAIVPMNDTNGSSLPNLPVLTTPDHAWKSGVIPSTIRVCGGKTLIQSKLELEPVGLERDGEVLPIDSLSYKPIQGWGWPEDFANVTQQDRHLAFKTVFRWYRPVSGWDGDGETISSSNQLELQDLLAETGPCSTDLYPLEPSVVGDYWPGCDHPIDAQNAQFDGPFKIMKDQPIVEFDRPVFRIVNDEVIKPNLYIIAAYYVRKEDFDGYSTYTKDLSVSASNQTTEPMVLNHPELNKVKIVNSAYPRGLPQVDNESALDLEANSYLSQIEQTFDYSSSQERHYAGILTTGDNLDVDGAIAQIEYQVGDGRLASTRVGRNTEFDLKTIQYRQARALHRLSQMAERLGL